MSWRSGYPWSPEVVLTTANQLHDVTVDGQRYIIKRSPCTAGQRNYYSGRMVKQCNRCTRWRPAWNQGYNAGHQSHIIMMCFCRDCGHDEFILDEWLKSESFIKEHTRYLRVQSDTKARNYERSFQHNWAEPLHETVKMVIDDLDAGDLEEAKIKLSTVLAKIEDHKRDYLAVEGYDPE